MFEISFRIWRRSWRRLWLWPSWVYLTATKECEPTEAGAEQVATSICEFVNKVRKSGLRIEYSVVNYKRV